MKWNSGKQVISCKYFKNGELKSLTDVSGKTLYYGYDINGRLETLKDEAGNNLTEYDYTVGGRIKEIRTSNGITTSYEYDGDGNISRLTIGNGTEEGLLYDAFMLYDLNGNRLGKTGRRIGVQGKQEMNTVFCYDSMNRLIMENRKDGGEKYAYDLGGNRLRKQHYHYALTANGNMDSVIDDEESYCYNERNELTERKSLSGVTTYLYDENGSLIREKEGEKETGYQYDLLNRQTHILLPNGQEQENLYDGEGLRAGLRESNKISTFLYYNGEILAECDGDGMPVRRHLTGQGLSHVQNLKNDTFHSYHQDELGSTAYVTGTTGEIENLYSYDGFGNILESREDITNRILYTGQQYDQETGQYYLRARYYNPVIGRFTQEDTYRGDGLNLYAYCGNNPVMYYDPSGYAGNSTPPATCGNTGDGEKPKDSGAAQVGEKSNTKTLYRGDKSTVTPDSVFENGFTPKGTHDDAWLHTKGNSTAGNFISTSEDFEIASEFARKNGYVYVIETDNYVDINATYGSNANFPEQKEFSIPGGVKPSEIVGAYKKQGGEIVGDFIPNPNYGGN